MFKPLALLAFLFTYSVFAQVSYPDVLIMTEELSAVPEDLVTKSFFSKVLSKEKIFKYQEEPDYYQIQGFLKRIAFEHKVTITDNIIKYLLEIPAEVAFWKSSDGKLKDFTFSSRPGKIKETISKFLLTVADIASDTQVSSFDDGGKKAFTLKLSNKSLTISINDGVIAVTTLGKEGLPWNRKEPNLDWKKGFYSQVFRTDLGKNKHKIILSGEFLTLGYSYFFPELHAMSFSFEKNWQVESLTSKAEGKFVTDTSDLWKGLPLSPAICLVIPVVGERAGKLLDEKAEKNQFSQADLSTMINSPVGVCWYEDSSIFTPLFAMKVGKVDGLKEKLKTTFERYIGDPPVEDETTKKSISSMKVNDRNNMFELTKDVEYYNNQNFTVKLALKGDFVFFSPDQKLVDQAVATAAGKGTPVADQLKGNKDIAVLFAPHKVSKLLEDYLHDALPSGQESVFRSSLESYFISSFKNLSQVKPFVLSMPKSFEDQAKWETLGMTEIP